MIRLMKIIGLICFLGFFAQSFSQEIDSYNPYKDYSKLTLVIQPAILDPGMTPKNQVFEYKNSFSGQLGMYYNFAQGKKWNFSTGLILKQFQTDYKLNIAKSDLTFPASSFTGEDLLLTGKESKDLLFSVPVRATYLMRLNNKNFITVGGSLAFNLQSNQNDFSKAVSIRGDDGDYNLYQSDNHIRPISFSGEFSLGYLHKFDKFLLNMEAFYNYSPTTVMESNYTISNTIYPDFIKGKSMNANYYGVSLQLTPQTNLFKKKE